MSVKIVIDGNSVYELDEECLECQKMPCYDINNIKQIEQELDFMNPEKCRKKKNTPSA